MNDQGRRLECGPAARNHTCSRHVGRASRWEAEPPTRPATAARTRDFTHTISERSGDHNRAALDSPAGHNLNSERATGCSEVVPSGLSADEYKCGREGANHDLSSAIPTNLFLNCAISVLVGDEPRSFQSHWPLRLSMLATSIARTVRIPPSPPACLISFLRISELNFGVYLLRPPRLGRGSGETHIGGVPSAINRPSMRASALSSKKKTTDPLGHGRAVKGARRAFISTLDSSPRAP